MGAKKKPPEIDLLFWDIAREGKRQTLDFISKDGPIEAVRVFDFAMTISDLNNLVHLTAQSKSSQGRAYSAGFTNAGVYERFDSFQYINAEDDGARTPLNVNSLSLSLASQCVRVRMLFVLKLITAY